jgi:thioredoxin reductase
LPLWQVILTDRARPDTVEEMNSTWDCIVVGAGAAGLSAGLVLGRAQRRTLVVDAEGQSNRVAAGIGGLLGHDTRSPDAFYAAGRAELAAYPTVELRIGEVVSAERDDQAFTLELADGSTEVARRVLLATGMDYRRPNLPGLEERWGGSVFHCPFCHGWEHRNETLGVLDRGDSSVHRALMLRAWSDEVTVYTDGDPMLEPADADRLHAAGVEVDERPVAGLIGPDRALTAITFADGGERPCGGLLVPVTLHQRSALAERLGVATREPTALLADAIAVDDLFATSVPGVFAAGDVTATMQSVANAVATGHGSAAMVVRSLMMAPSGEAQVAGGPTP